MFLLSIAFISSCWKLNYIKLKILHLSPMCLYFCTFHPSVSLWRDRCLIVQPSSLHVAMSILPFSWSFKVLMFKILNSKINSWFLLSWHIFSQTLHVFQLNVVSSQLTIVNVVSSSGSLIEYMSVFKGSSTFLKCSVIFDFAWFSELEMFPLADMWMLSLLV